MRLRRYIAFAGVMVAVIIGVTVFSLLPRTSSFPLPSVNVTVSPLPPVSYRQLTTGSWNDRWPSWSPDGKSIAYASDRGGLGSIWMMDVSGLHARQVSSTSVIVAHPTWSPDSSAIAYWSLNGQVAEFQVVNLSNGAIYSVPGSGPYAIQGRAEWSPDGKRLLFFEEAVTTVLVVADIRSSTSVLVANASGTALTAAWLSDSSVLYSMMMGNASYIREVNLSTGNISSFAGDGRWNFTAPAVASDGSVAYYSNWMPDTYLSYEGSFGYNVWFNRNGDANGTWAFRLLPDPYDGSILVPVPFIPGMIDTSEPAAWNSNATRITYSTRTSESSHTLFVWDTVNLTTFVVGPVLGSGCDAFEPTWSPDGLSIAFCCNLGEFYHIWVTSATGVSAVTSPFGY